MKMKNSNFLIIRKMALIAQWWHIKLQLSIALFSLLLFFHEVLESTQINTSMKSNQEKFSILRQFNLPIDQYAITGSGPLGIRNLKVIGDIDIIVSEKLWNKLASKYGITDQNGVKKIIFPGGIVEAFHQGSFYSEPIDDKAPTYAWRIANAEIIDSLPFDSLETILYYKNRDRREKDLQDIKLIEKWMRSSS